MTREEAIEVLKKQIDKCTLVYAEGIAALKHVIKDLEQQPCKGQEFYMATRILSEDELKHLEEQIKKARPQLISVEQEPCEDCISRETLLKYLETITKDTNPRHYESKDEWYHDNGFNLCKVRIEKFVKNLAPATPQPKIGHWEWVQYDRNPKIGNWHCSECRSVVVECVCKSEKGGIPLYKYCPQCGAKMAEAEDVSDTNFRK